MNLIDEEIKKFDELCSVEPNKKIIPDIDISVEEREKIESFIRKSLQRVIDETKEIKKTLYGFPKNCKHNKSSWCHLCVKKAIDETKEKCQKK